MVVRTLIVLVCMNDDSGKNINISLKQGTDIATNNSTVIINDS